MEETEREDRQPLLTLRVRMEEKEIYRCLMLGTRRAGPARNIVQSVILGLLAVYCGAAYLLDEAREPVSLMLTVISLLVLAAIWVTPPLRMRSEARRIAEQGNELFLSLYEKEAAFGRENPKYAAYSACRAAVDGELLVLEIGRELVGIPRRVTDEAGWVLLLEKFRPEEGRMK
ncbi:MAG TPA: hypothetical protein H9684_09745 [Firmicutes bacterium]|nr:hypothetical protein [Bacillota bacterium]